jgi:hypothetical protein
VEVGQLLKLATNFYNFKQLPVIYLYFYLKELLSAAGEEMMFGSLLLIQGSLIALQVYSGVAPQLLENIKKMCLRARCETNESIAKFHAFKKLKNAFKKIPGKCHACEQVRVDVLNFYFCDFDLQFSYPPSSYTPFC